MFLNELRHAEQLTLNHANMRALFQSSGKYKAKKLARFNPPHPYAARWGGVKVPYGDPARINVQTGKFYMAWRQQRTRLQGNSLVSVLENPSTYSNRLALGITDKTIPRPLIPRIMPNVQFHRERNLMKGLRNAINKM
jgi:hypothetical protein